MIQTKDNVAVNAIKKSSGNLIKVLIKSDSQDKISLAFDIVVDIYQDLLDEYKNGNVNAIKKTPITLFGDNLDELCEGVKKLRRDEVLDVVWSKKLCELVLCTVYMSDDNNVIDREVENLRFFFRTVGLCLLDANRKGDTYNHNMWVSYISSKAFYNDTSIPKSKIYNYHRSYNYVLFDLIYGLFVQKNYRLIEDGFISEYLGWFKFHNSGDVYRERWQCFTVFAVYGYLYYVFYYGDKCGASKDEIEGAKSLLFSNITVIKINDYIRWCVTDDKKNRLKGKTEGVLDRELTRDLSAFLRRYEIFGILHKAHIIYTEQAAKEFFLFVMSYASMRYRDEVFLERTIDINEYRNYMEEGEIQHIKEVFATLLPMVERYKTEKRNQELKAVETGKTESYYTPSDAKVEELVRYLYKWMKTKYTDDEIVRAQKEQEEYNKQVNEVNLIHEIKEVVDKSIKDSYKPIMRSIDTKEAKKKISQKINLLNLNSITSYTNMDELCEVCSVEPVRWITHWISAMLINSHVVSPCRKNDVFNSDDEYIKYIEDNIDVMIGSEWVINDIDYINIDKFQERTKKINKFHSFSDYGLLIKKDAISVKIKNIDVTIKSPTEDEIVNNAKKVDNDQYVYEIYSGFKLKFKKDELVQYVRNKRKIVNIDADIELKTYMDDIGIVMVRD